MDTSIILMGVKIAMDNSITTKFENPQFTSSINKDIVSKDDINAYLDGFVNGIKSFIGPSFSNDIPRIEEQIDDIKAFSPFDNDVDFTTASSFYDKSVGRFTLFMFYTSAMDSNNNINVETLALSGDFRLADNAVTVWNSKGKKKWEETVYVPASLTAKALADAVASCLKDVINETDLSIINRLKEAALKIDTSEAIKSSDKLRRTYINPTTRSSVEITDPALYSLIPTTWLKSSGDFSDVVYHPEIDTFDVLV